MPTLEQHRAAPRTRARDPQPDPPAARGRLSLSTLAAASVASVVAAVFVSRVWGPGTLYGAAATPVIVALVSEAVQRPRRAIESARRTRAFDPVAEGRRGLREGDLATLEPATGSRRSDHRVPVRRMPARRSAALALATGALAFAVGAFALTGGELVFGGSSVGGGSSRTTLFGGSSSSSHSSSGGSTKGARDGGRSTRDGGSTTSTSQRAPAPAAPQGTTTGTTTAPAPAAPQSGGTSAPQGDTQTAPATPATPDGQTTPAPTP